MQQLLASDGYLHDGRGDEELFNESPGAQIVTEANGQVLQDGFNGVTRLLARNPQIFLQRPRHRRENRLRCLVRVHWHCRTYIINQFK